MCQYSGLPPFLLEPSQSLDEDAVKEGAGTGGVGVGEERGVGLADDVGGDCREGW